MRPPGSDLAQHRGDLAQDGGVGAVDGRERLVVRHEPDVAVLALERLDGCLVVRQQPTADNGDIVAALLDNEATVKTFKRKDGHVWLMPHNEAFSPIDGDFATILGKVTAVLRKV